MVKSYRETFNLLDSDEFNTAPFPSVRSLYSFNMQHYIDVGVQYFAPEDAYSFSTFVFAIDRSTNKSIPIITFEIGSSGSGDFGSTSEVVPSSNQFTYNPGTGPTTVGVKSHTILAGVSRSVPARALTYSMFAINWILAFCSIITTSVSFNRGGGGGDLGITLLPVTVILTIPAVRNLYVGSPPFGIFLGTYKNHGAPFPNIEALLRRGGILSTNADSSVMHRGGIVWLCGQVDARQRFWFRNEAEDVVFH